jgi:formate dehydrogenase iron-sulfur subunit
MNSTTATVYVPRDTTALSLGANQVAEKLQQACEQRGVALNLVRNGSRGLFWLEPMLEVETPRGRLAFGPVQAEHIDALLDSGFLQGSESHPLCLGLTQDIEYLRKQQRLTFARVGVIDPVSIDHYCAHGGFAGLKNALAKTPQDIVTEVADSGLRGRGGAAFPTGIKWQTVLDANAKNGSLQKYIVCNADEGDSGTYADRMLMEGDPLCLIEGMIIAGLAVKATLGYIYLREEYPQAHKILNEAIAAATSAGYLGQNIGGSGQRFELDVRLGAGAYICGEETALLDSLEGKRGMVRAKPPLPAIEGLFGLPTVVNNVISLASVPMILDKGATSYRDYGVGRSRGTVPFQLAGNVKRAGLVELAFGPSLRELLEGFGGGTRSGRAMRAVQVGGPLGAYLPESQWDTALDYEAFADINAVLGHGGVVVFDDSVDMLEQAQFAMEFCAEESCGKCTPCRIGSVRGVEVIDKVRQGVDTQKQKQLLQDLCDTMINGSLCAMGGMTPFPVLSALNHFSEDFDK